MTVSDAELTNARLYGQPVPTSDQYPALLAVSESIISHKDLPALFHGLGGWLRQVARFNYFTLVLNEPAANGLRMHVLESAEPVPDGFITVCARIRTPYVLRFESEFPDHDTKSVPMLVNLTERYLRTRQFSERLCDPLTVEDFVVQSMPDASPTRWHLAHTTWFFETFVLARWEAGYRPISTDYQFLFNSYYNGVGEQFPRSRRGLLTRPNVAEVFQYRREVDERMLRLLSTLGDNDAEETARVVELGLNHEQQHQELMLTDIKHLFSCNPLWPTYRASPGDPTPASQLSDGWSAHHGGIVQVGHEGPGFAFDNECPRHSVMLQPFAIHQRLVTAGEFLAFMDDDGYRRSELWLSLGWSTLHDQECTAPLYWVEQDGQWHEFSLSGLRPINTDAPVCHISYFEADAFSRWSGARLPTEAEWEHAVNGTDPQGSFLESEHYHPTPVNSDHGSMAQFYGEVWQWTASPYTPYPGYVAPPGALGEYNGKFMCNQYVLRGGSCVTPASHIRATYRNFFPPEARWQFSGIRLARDAEK